MPKVSVIVPVYNVAEFLPKCVSSLLAQTYEDYEIILLDDGSTDNSGELCDVYAREQEKISVIHQQNQGLGGARNTGIAYYRLDIGSSSFVMVGLKKTRKAYCSVRYYSNAQSSYTYYIWSKCWW